MKIDIHGLEHPFSLRHIGPGPDELQDMLTTIGVTSIEELIEQTIPERIRRKETMNLPDAKGEHEFLTSFEKLMDQNTICKNYIGMGYYNCSVPPPIQRNLLENPGWDTAYTPYQAEIAQGRLEALVNFQTMVVDLTGMELANASLLDEGTAAAEAMSMFYGKRPKSKKKAERFFVDENVFPQTLSILRTRAEAVGIELVVSPLTNLDLTDEALYGVFLQYPDNNGAIHDHTDLIAAAREADVQVVVAADLMSLVLLTPPGEMGAHTVVGTTQRFGIPYGYGGPHAAYFACLETYKRQIPGRIIGLSKDSHGHPAYRMALQTREQHIRREKATSNICTAQVLLAVMAGMYGVYHGPSGLRRIAARIHGLTHFLHEQLRILGFDQINEHFFDTLKVRVENISKLRSLSEEKSINLRYFNDDSHVGISLDETTTEEDLFTLISLFAELSDISLQSTSIPSSVELNWPDRLVRKSGYMTDHVFEGYHSEHEMLRYIKRLENKDVSLTHSMISLGSCTMKLNATTEMIPVTWAKVGGIHPFAPQDQVRGYRQMLTELTEWLAEITGFDAVSLQPNSGAQGEFAGLMTIKAYHESRGEGHRNVTLIPTSAHGTNPASAVMAGQRVVLVDCDEDGNIDVSDLKAKAELHAENLAALMVTYPSTHGVFEEDIQDICATIHHFGGQVYMDGANMNAQVGLTSPALIGADVCHLNLHKTFCIPHGGGGPGVGPIGVAAQLTPFLPSHDVVKVSGSGGSISAAPFGSASICVIPYAYIAMMGAAGLTRATEVAIINANYIKAKLEDHYPILYTNQNDRSAHEMIIDCREYKKDGIEVADIAKRLMDYGFHAPTVSFPVPGTMMIEPTESETKAEMDRFCDAMIGIRSEIASIIDGTADQENNILKNAPHTYELVAADNWELPYSRTEAAFPLPYVKANKFWPSVGRIDNAFGDRNLMCTCAPLEVYADKVEVATSN
ncbi:MAG: aminomethyl-transferring glycine dehydrogenase [Bacteroidota bacterium]